MRVLLAGGLGLVGTATAKALCEAGHTVVLASRSARAQAGFEAIAVDLGQPITAVQGFGSLDAVVNVVGIAREQGDNTFERAHVDATRHLLALAAATGAQRFVHISVVAVDRARSAYHDTKRRAEGLVRDAHLAWTILRPGLIYGPGDDMISNLAQFVRAAPVFVAPRDAGPLQVVDVLDVADAVTRSLDPGGAASVGQTIDVVGPVRYRLAELVAEVSAALAMQTLVVRLPTGLMRAAVAVLGTLTRNPPLTPTQLEMLVLGLAGDPAPARALLGLESRPLTQPRIAAIADSVPARLPSMRLVPTAAHRSLLERARQTRSWLWLPGLATAMLLALPYALPDIWLRMGLVNLLLGAVALRWVALPWRSLFTPRLRDALWGLACAGVMGIGAVLMLHALDRVAPGWLAQASEVYGWTRAWSLPVTVALVTVIAAAEDVVWRFAIGLPLCAKLGPLPGAVACGALFALAHATTGPPVLVLAAFVAGTTWTAIAVRSRSILTTAVAHVCWDLGMLWIAPN